MKRIPFKDLDDYAIKAQAGDEESVLILIQSLTGVAIRKASKAGFHNIEDDVPFTIGKCLHYWEAGNGAAFSSFFITSWKNYISNLYQTRKGDEKKYVNMPEYEYLAEYSTPETKYTSNRDIIESLKLIEEKLTETQKKYLTDIYNGLTVVEIAKKYGKSREAIYLNLRKAKRDILTYESNND